MEFADIIFYFEGSGIADEPALHPDVLGIDGGDPPNSHLQ